MTLRQTHTFAELEVSEEVYEEVAKLLREAGYWHVFMDNGAIDMHGIGLTKGASGSNCRCAHSRGRHITPIHGQPLGRCRASGCKCEEFQAAEVAE